jgi:UDP-glucosyltransferase 73C
MTCFTKQSNESHFILVPLAAQGHLIPMVDIGRVIAKHGVRVSLIITLANADRIKPINEGAKEKNLSIEFVEFNFPNEKFGLPPGCESVDHITKVEHFRAFFDAFYSLNKPLEAFI